MRTRGSERARTESCLLWGYTLSQWESSLAISRSKWYYFLPRQSKHYLREKWQGLLQHDCSTFSGLGVGTRGQARVILKATERSSLANIYHAAGSKEILEIRGQETVAGCFLCVKCDTKGAQRVGRTF